MVRAMTGRARTTGPKTERRLEQVSEQLQKLSDKEKHDFGDHDKNEDFRLSQSLPELSRPEMSRPPLPLGSETFFRALAAELPGSEVKVTDKGEGQDEGSGVLRRFRSKTAEEIHLSRFGSSFPGYMERLSREHPACVGREGEQEEGPLLTGSHDNLPSHTSKHVTWGGIGVSTYVKGSIVQRSLPNSPRLLRMPDRKPRGGILLVRTSPTESCDTSWDGSRDSSPVVKTRTLRTSCEDSPCMRNEKN